MNSKIFVPSAKLIPRLGQTDSAMPPGLGKRELDRRRTSAAIRTAALDLFDRDGYDATTVERIAEASGVSQRTFFRYFPRKEALLFGDGLQALVVALLRARPRGEPLLTSLREGSIHLPGADDHGTELRRRLRDGLIHEHPSILAYGRSLLAELAQRCGMDPDEISRIELGSTSPTARTLQRVAEALDADVRLVDRRS